MYMSLWGGTCPTYLQKCMQWRKWRNWRKIASRWRFELDAKSGPLEAGDFGEIGDFGKNRHACNGENGETGEKSPASGDLNWMPKVAPWRLAILAKMAILAINCHFCHFRQCVHFWTYLTCPHNDPILRCFIESI